jgi:16S rRNA U1498 N3-methylase RsmE
MHRFYIPPENWNPDSLVLTGSEAHHARDVLRMKRSGEHRLPACSIRQPCRMQILREAQIIGRI